MLSTVPPILTVQSEASGTTASQVRPSSSSVALFLGLSGQLTEEEKLVSSYISQIWVNFASAGNPGLESAQPWSIEAPVYTKVGLITS